MYGNNYFFERKLGHMDYLLSETYLPIWDL